MAINEKKPLFVRIAGERQPNLLPVTASAVGFDFNRDRFVFYHTASDDWADISPDGVDFVGSVYADNFFASGVVTASLGLSGSLTTLADGTSYLIAGAGIDITSASNGPVTISSLITQQPEYWQSDVADTIFTTGSAEISGSLFVSASITGSNLVLDDAASRILAPNGALVISASAGTFLTGTFVVSGTRSNLGTEQSSILFNGDLFVSGGIGVNDYLQLKPVNTLLIPTNTTASYIYVSGSTNDLYFTQYDGPYTNTTRLRWLESTLSTGLLHGGVLSTQNGTTTFSITSGSGLVVSFNASTTTDPYPTIKFVGWPAYVSQSLAYSGSAQISYIGINDSGGLIQRTTPFDPIDFEQYIPIGRILHQSGSVTNGTITSPHVSYGLPTSHDTFVRAFGPLKLNGHVLAASGTTLGLTKTGGDSYVEGRNYTSNPSSPDLVLSTTDFALTNSKIFREYVSGSTPVIDTGVGTAGYAVIDPTKYVDGNGALQTVASGQYTIQRVYWFPNSVNRALFVYYGTATYNSIDVAQASITDEGFAEGANTAGAAIFVGYIIVKGNASDLSDDAQAKIIQAPLFRAAGVGGGASGAGATTPGGLDTYVQFNDGGSTFGGDAGFTYNKNTDTLTVGNVNVATNATVSGSLTVGGIAALNGNIILGNAAADQIYVSGSLTASNGLTLTGSSTFAAGSTFTFSGSAVFAGGLSGSLTQLANGSSYLVAGTNITITSQSNGQVQIAATDPTPIYWQSNSQDVIFTTGSAQITGSLYAGSDAYLSGSLWQGDAVLATGLRSHAQGQNTWASGNYSHAEGYLTTGSGIASHAEGGESAAIGIYAHAEGYRTVASGTYSHAEGHEAYASGTQSHAEGFNSLSVGISSHAEGFFTTSSGDDSHSEGFRTIAFGYASHAEGSETITIGEKSHAEGQLTIAWGPISHAEGYQTTASANTSHAEGAFTNASGTFSHTEGWYTSTYGIGSHAEGFITTASGDYSHAQGSNTHASGVFSHAAGGNSIAYGESSHAEGGNTIAYGFASHTEGFFTTTGPAALGSHAEGAYTNANGSVSHTEGAYTLAEADASHAEGYLTTGSGIGSHSEGYLTHASASYSHAGGVGTIASGSGQTAIGSYNIKGNDFSLFVIGDGTDDSNRSDILRVNPGVSAGVGRVEVSGTLVATLALSGSLTQLPDGTSYLIAGTGISIASESNGAVTIASTVGASPEYWFSTGSNEVYTTGSAIVQGDLTVVGTIFGGSPVKMSGGAVVTGALEVTNYLTLNPYESSQVPIGTTDSAYLFASGALGKLYFGSYHDEDAEEQKISLDWIKGGSLHTGLLYGGRLTTAVGSTTFSITSGSGLIVRFRTSDTKDPYPFVKQVTWDNFISQSLTYVTSSQLSYIGIDISGSIVQQPFPFTPDDRNNVLTLGRISHPTLTTAQLANMFPDIAYGSQEWHDEFTRAFGPLKISGHTLTPSGSSLRVNKGAGSAYIAGGNYFFNSDRPSSVLDTEDTEKTNLIYVRLWVSGTDLKIEANPPLGFSALDPNNYNLDGAKTAVPSGSFSVQRLYWIPRNSRDVINGYYGSAVYSTLGDAVAGITTENFVESDNTKTSNIFLGYVAVQSGSTDLSDPMKAKIIQAGLSRNVAGGGGAAGTGVVVPGGLPGYVQYNLNGTDFAGEADFTYNSTTNLLTVGSASFGGDGELSTTAATFNLLDTTAQTINFGGAATTIDVGSTAGTTTLFGAAKAPQGLSGSLTQLTDGTSYLIAGANVTITSASNGAVTISSTGGGGGGDQYWLSSQNEAVYTTGSALFRGPGGTADSPSDLGTDLFFFVSGAVYSKDTAVTGTAAFGGDLVVSGATYFENTVTVGQFASPVVLDVFADSVFYSSTQFTSNVLLGDSAADSIQVTGSLDVSGSAVFMSGLSGSLTQLTDGTSYLIAGTNIGITTQSNGSVTIDNTAAVYAPAGAQGQVQYYDGGNFGGSSLFTFTPAVGAVTASVFVATAVSASSVVSGSKIWGGEIEATQYVKIDSGFEYTSIPIGVTNSVYMFVSGVNKALHFAHYNEVENQTAVTDIASYDGLLQTGLRWGGFLSAAPGATTFSITSGSGQIVRYHTSPDREPDPFIKQVEWSNFVSQSLTYVTSSQFTYVAIDENGGILQQTVPYSLEGSGDVIFLGRVNHVNSTAQNAVMLPETTYAQVASFVDFARAFGPLKVSGHTLAPSGSSLRVTKTGGDSFIKGGNYLYNQDRPSYITSAEDGDKPAPLFVYLYTSGSNLNVLSNAGLGFPAIDPNNYNASGTLTALPSGTFTNLRVFYQPRNLQGYLSVYYGPSYYSTLAEASNGLDNESFEEHPTSKLAAILCGYITVQSGSTDLSSTSQAKILQAGLFRSSVGLTAASAGGGGGTPGGSDTQVQFNQGGTTFAGDAQFTFNSTTNVLTVGNAMVGGTGQLMGSGVTFDLLDSTVQTINFGGAATTIDVGSTAGTNTLFGATKMPQGLSGSLTHLTDGSSYLIAGTGIQITSASSGAVTIENGGITAVTAGTGLTGGGTSGAVTLNINNSVVATVSGSTFTGAVKFNSGLSGSLTQLTDGSSYLIAGENTQVVSGSNGAITISTPSYVFRKAIYLLG